MVTQDAGYPNKGNFYLSTCICSSYISNKVHENNNLSITQFHFVCLIFSRSNYISVYSDVSTGYNHVTKRENIPNTP